MIFKLAAVVGLTLGLAVGSAQAQNPNVVNDGTTSPVVRDVDRNVPNNVNRVVDDGFDMGWLGLIGLAGLAGLMPRSRVDRVDVTRSDMPRSGTVR